MLLSEVSTTRPLYHSTPFITVSHNDKSCYRWRRTSRYDDTVKVACVCCVRVTATHSWHWELLALTSLMINCHVVEIKLGIMKLKWKSKFRMNISNHHIFILSKNYTQSVVPAPDLLNPMKYSSSDCTHHTQSKLKPATHTLFDSLFCITTCVAFAAVGFMRCWFPSISCRSHSSFLLQYDKCPQCRLWLLYVEPLQRARMLANMALITGRMLQKLQRGEMYGWKVILPMSRQAILWRHGIAVKMLTHLLLIGLNWLYPCLAGSWEGALRINIYIYAILVRETWWSLEFLSASLLFSIRLCQHVVDKLCI